MDIENTPRPSDGHRGPCHCCGTSIRAPRDMFCIQCRMAHDAAAHSREVMS